VIQNKTNEIFADHYFEILPTTPCTAFEIGKNSGDPITMYLQDIFTVHANLAGNPAISLPLGQHSNGLPFGIQVMGNHFDEAVLLSFSNHLMNEIQ
jgi:aspartyl-tRNA(Asn)/glutamyl-tRNA(Gln) amidotransferase subunit A